MAELKPCPFCGSKDLEVVDAGGIFWVLCQKCRAMGPNNKYGLQKSIEFWNRREKK